MSDPAWLSKLRNCSPSLLGRLRATTSEIGWIRQASADDLLTVACNALGSQVIASPFDGMSAVDLGDLPSRGPGSAGADVPVWHKHRR